MKKDDFIAIYGVEKYNEQKKKIAENTRKRNQMKKENKIANVLTDFDDSVTGKTYLIIPRADTVEEDNRLIEKEAFKFQKHLNRLWRTQTNKPFILVVDEYSRRKDGKVLMKCNLTQLHMSGETREHFKEIVKTGSENY